MKGKTCECLYTANQPPFSQQDADVLPPSFTFSPPMNHLGTAHTTAQRCVGMEAPGRELAPSEFGVCFPFWTRSHRARRLKGPTEGSLPAWEQHGWAPLVHSRSWGSNALLFVCQLSNHHCLNINLSGNF